jgi:hypothetical protein
LNERIAMYITGECFCGGIKYRIEGKLDEARSCHCSRCRKAFSAPASAGARVDSDAFKWLSGESLLTTYEIKDGFGLQFCSRCGSTLCRVHNGAVYVVTLGCVNGDPEVEIGMHTYVGSKAKWEIVPDGVSQFLEGPPD